jgi:dolichol-phosphate mannosyltransferase
VRGPKTGRGLAADEGGAVSLSIVLGTLNERAALPELIGRIDNLELPPYELVIVDDGSTDGTREYVRSLAAADPRVRLLVHTGPRTLIPAQSEGVEAARGEYVIIMDSDLQHPPEKIPEIYRHLSGGAGLVIASRYEPAGSAGDRSTFRSVISHGAEVIVRALICEARSVSDPMSGFYGFHRSLFRPPVPMHRGYHMLPYLLVITAGTKIREVPYSFGRRLTGTSKVTQSLGFIRIFLGQMMVTLGIRSALRGRARTLPRVAPEPSLQVPERTRTGSTITSPSSRSGIAELRR